MDNYKLCCELSHGDYSNIIEACKIRNDKQIYELMNAIANKESEEYQFLIMCLSDKAFLREVNSNPFYVTASIFPRICKISDEDLKLEWLKMVKNSDLRIMIMLSIQDITLRDKYMMTVSREVLIEFVKYLRNKELVLRILPYIYRVDETIYYEIKGNLSKGSTMMYRTLVNSILNIENKEEQLNMLRKYYFVDGLLIDVLKSINDEGRKRFLIGQFFPIKKCHYYIKTSGKDYFIPNYKSVLPKSLTFGVEIECFGDMARPIMLYSNKLCGYDVKAEEALPDGLEFTSPILTWNREDLKSIYKVCDFATSNGLRCVGRSGGHIHFSSDYLDTKDAWYWFFYLYSKFEMILYKISNPEGQSPRKNIMSISMPFSGVYVDNLDKIIKCVDKDEYIEEVQNLFNCRFIGINLDNIFKRFNTIEFRMPNGSLDADEIVKRVLLFGNLIVCAKRLSLLPLEKNLYELIYKLDNTQDEEELLEILVNLLFKSEEEKEIFRRRYQANKIVKDEASLKHRMKSYSFRDKGISI